jgi:chromosome segregation ATPase
MGQCFSFGKEHVQAEGEWLPNPTFNWIEFCQIVFCLRLPIEHAISPLYLFAENAGAKFVKLASLKLQDAGTKVVASGVHVSETAHELTAAKALIEEAKSSLDKFNEANRISEADLQAVQAKVNEAKELVGRAGGSRDVEESIARAEEALASAMTATKKESMANLAADAATAASDGARAMKKTASSTGGRNLTKVTSNVSEAEKALGAVALKEVYGDGANAKDLKAANATVDFALKALDEEIKVADGDLAAELKEVKSNMEKAAINLVKRTSFK